MRKAFLAVSLVVSLAAPVSASDQDQVVLGKITPDGPYSIWTNINTLLDQTTAMDFTDPDTGRRMSAEGLFPVTGMTPGDVMDQVRAFRTGLDRLRAKAGLPATGTYTDRSGQAVTPAVVYVNSANLLDSLVGLLVTVASPGVAMGEYYRSVNATGKKPSDVYALAERANRRIGYLQSDSKAD